MQKKFTTFCVALVLVVMLLVAVPGVNYSSTVPVWNNGSQLADGIPMPPPKPPKTGFASRCNHRRRHPHAASQTTEDRVHFVTTSPFCARAI